MKRNMRGIRVLFVFIIIAAVLAACSSNNNVNNDNTTNSNTSSETESSAQPTGDSNEAIKDAYELTMAVPVFGAIPADTEAVVAEINKITQAEINTTVNILPISIGNYAQQMNLMTSSGEKLDLAYAFGQAGYYATQVVAGKTLPLDDLLEQYGQSIITEVGGADNMSAAKVNGEIHGVPLAGLMGAIPAVYMRKDLVEKHNIDVNAIKSIEDLTNVFQVIKENEPDLAPLAIGLSTPFDYYRTYDKLGDGYGVLPGYDNGLKVENYYESQEYADLLALVHSWFKAGYINKDAATTQNLPAANVKAGQAFSYFMSDGPGIITGEEILSNHELVNVRLDEAYTTTSDVLVGLWTIAQQSEKPDRAMMFLNLMYTNKEIANLLAWGIEGKHYVKVGENVIDYPEGVDATTVAYVGQGWMMGNPNIQYKIKSSVEPVTREEVLAFNESTNKSKALGFMFNSNEVKNEITALNNVAEQYKKVLESGTVDPADKLPEFISKLKSAGIDKVLAEKQRQLDEWAAAKNQ